MEELGGQIPTKRSRRRGAPQGRKLHLLWDRPTATNPPPLRGCRPVETQPKGEPLWGCQLAQMALYALQTITLSLATTYTISLAIKAETLILKIVDNGQGIVADRTQAIVKARDTGLK